MSWSRFFYFRNLVQYIWNLYLQFRGFLHRGKWHDRSKNGSHRLTLMLMLMYTINVRGSLDVATIIHLWILFGLYSFRFNIRKTVLCFVDFQWQRNQNLNPISSDLWLLIILIKIYPPCCLSTLIYILLSKKRCLRVYTVA